MTTAASINPGDVLIELLNGRGAVTDLVGEQIYLREVPRELVAEWAADDGSALPEKVTPTLIVEMTASESVDESKIIRCEFNLNAMAASEAQARSILSQIAEDLDEAIGLPTSLGNVATMTQTECAESDRMDDTEFCYATAKWQALIAIREA